MPKEAPSHSSIAPRRGPDGRFTSGIQEIQHRENDDAERLELSDEEMVEEVVVPHKRSAPPKISEAMAAASRKQHLEKIQSEKTTARLLRDIRSYENDRDNPMHPEKIAKMNAHPRRTAELRAKRIITETEALDPMDPRRIDALKDPMHPLRVAAMNARPERIDEMTAKWSAEENATEQDPMSPKTIAKNQATREAVKRAVERERAQFLRELKPYRQKVTEKKERLQNIADQLADRGEFVELPFQYSTDVEEPQKKSLFGSIGKSIRDLLRSRETRKLLTEFEKARAEYAATQNELAEFVSKG